MSKKTQTRELQILRQIESRWIDYNSNDISLFRPLPAWEHIISDIETLLELAGSSFTTQEELDKEYQLGWDDGYDEALREHKKK